VKIEAVWRGGLSFDGTNESGKTLHLESPSGVTPMEAILIALAGCTGMDVVSILEKMRVKISGLKIAVEATRKDEHPKVFDSILITYIIEGEGVFEDKVKRAIDLSQEKYCSVSAMLRKAAEVKYQYRIIGNTRQEAENPTTQPQE